jgi:histidinol-phosphate phosphatase family protein
MVEALHWDHRRPAAFLDRDGVINVEVNGVHQPDQLELLRGVAAGIRRLNQAGWLVAAVTNQPDIAKGFLSEASLEAVHRSLERRLGEEHAWLDDLIYCPHHPDSGFPGERRELKTTCPCRKPSAGMLESLSERLPVERETSVMIGDSWRDMAAAHSFGVDAIGVLTGHAMGQPPPPERALDGRPDVVVDDLSQAVCLLLDTDPGVEELFQQALKLLEDPGARPLVILVAGLSRVGKSALAFQLRRLFRSRGLLALSVRLDDWLVPEAARPAGSSVADRYRLADAERDLRALARGEAASAPGYDPRTRGPLASRVLYHSEGAKVLIVEGVPALLLEMSGVRHLRVHLDAASEEDRARRVHRFYQLKGLSSQETRELLRSRSEEHAAVAEAASSAQLRFEPRPLGAA